MFPFTQDYTNEKEQLAGSSQNEWCPGNAGMHDLYV